MALSFRAAVSNASDPPSGSCNVVGRERRREGKFPGTLAVIPDTRPSGRQSRLCCKAESPRGEIWHTLRPRLLSATRRRGQRIFANEEADRSIDRNAIGTHRTCAVASTDKQTRRWRAERFGRLRLKSRAEPSRVFSPLRLASSRQPRFFPRLRSLSLSGSPRLDLSACVFPRRGASYSR